MEEYNHIEIQKEDNIYSYKGRPFPLAPKPPIRDNAKHGEKLKGQIFDTSTKIIKTRKDKEINSENLIVLEVESEAISEEILQVMQDKFNMYIVEETVLDENKNNSKLIVQFDTKEDIDRFNNERQCWQEDNKDDQILTWAKRRDLFNSIENIRSISSEDRMGIRLKEAYERKDKILDNYFIVNIDAWYNNDKSTITEIEKQIKTIIGTGKSKILGDMLEIPGLILGRALVNEFSLNALLNADIIASVDLPYEPISQEPYRIYSNDYQPIIEGELDKDSPLATVMDSGVFSGNPLLSNCILGEEEFDTSENTTSDINGHGTAVAGIVAYGDFDKVIKENKCKPTVRICNAKVMHNDSSNNPVFPENERPEIIVKKAVEFFYKNYGCRIFNLSAGIQDNIYNGGRQFAWAGLLDDLSRKLDVLIIISAGNVSNPYIDKFKSRQELMSNVRDQLFSEEHRLIDPATSALNITVGSITRYDETTMPRDFSSNTISIGKRNYPSAFTRIGKGINKSIKPEFMDYGGNYALKQAPRGINRWDRNNINLLEPTLNNSNDKIFKGYCGTSFSAPHVTNIAARIENCLEKQLGERPSVNLIKAMLGNSAEISNDMKEWVEQSRDINYTGTVNMKQDRCLRLLGYGKLTENLMHSTEKNVTLFAEDALDLRSFHLYKIPVPKEFLTIRSNKSIKISLAYNPMTKLSRKDYLANNLWFEVFRKIDEATLIKYRTKKQLGEDTEDDFKSLPNCYKADFTPGYETLLRSTLQQRIWTKGSGGGRDLLMDNNNEPYIYILVTGKERFRYLEQDKPQDYALCITFSYDAKENIGLYNKINSRANIVLTRDRDNIKTDNRVRIK